jgi:hypothetical protein
MSGLWLKLALYGAIAASLIGLGYGIADTISARKIATMQRDYANERVIAAEATRHAEAEARRIETGWRAWVSDREKDYASNAAVTAASVAALSRSNVGLRERITAFTKPGIAAADSCPAAVNLQNRLERVGILLTEVDGLAFESATVADATGDELKLCRGYVEGLSK